MQRDSGGCSAAVSMTSLSHLPSIFWVRGLNQYHCGDNSAWLDLTNAGSSPERYLAGTESPEGVERGTVWKEVRSMPNVTPSIPEPILRKEGDGVSRFHVSLIVGDRAKRQCPQATTFEEEEKLQPNRNEVRLFTCLGPYR